MRQPSPTRRCDGSIRRLRRSNGATGRMPLVDDVSLTQWAKGSLPASLLPALRRGRSDPGAYLAPALGAVSCLGTETRGDQVVDDDLSRLAGDPCRAGFSWLGARAGEARAFPTCARRTGLRCARGWRAAPGR